MSGIVANGTNPGAVVVLDAAASLGRAVAAAALEAGRHVIAVSPDGSVPVDLAARHPRRLSHVAGSVQSDAHAQLLAGQLRAQARPLAAIVTAVDAGQLRGRLLDQPVDTTCSDLAASLAPQLAAARHLLPLLREGGRSGSFLLIGGPGSRHPWAGYGQRSLNEAALRMLARVLHCEARAQDVRLHLLSVERPAWGVDAGPPRADWPSALDVGQRAIALLDAPASADAVVCYDALASSSSASPQTHASNAAPATPARDARANGKRVAGSRLSLREVAS